MQIPSEKELREFEAVEKDKAALFIAEKMRQNGLTCYSIAKRSGVSTHAVLRIVNKNDVSFKTLVKVIRTLGGNIFFA